MATQIALVDHPKTSNTQALTAPVWGSVRTMVGAWRATRLAQGRR
ncbi:hypothetical protein [Archangium lipolyticum]|nr:hypothetical protein [Archangium lipolyticum]